MMSSEKAVVAVLVVCVSLCRQQADGACTFQQKEILNNCKLYLIYPWLREGVPPSYTTRCCKSVKKVPGMDMHCILNLCTQEDKRTVLPDSLLKLKGHCSLWPLGHAA